MQELRCSCEGRGGRKQVNLLSGSRSLSPVSQRCVSGLCEEGNRTASAEEIVSEQHICPDARVMWALHVLLLFCGVIFVGRGEAHGKQIPKCLQPHRYIRIRPHKLPLSPAAHKSPGISAYAMAEEERRCAAGSAGASPQPHCRTHGTAPGTPYIPPLPSLINMGSAESPRTSSTLLCTCTHKILRAEETATAPSSALQTPCLPAATENCTFPQEKDKSSIPSSGSTRVFGPPAQELREGPKTLSLH